jgi:hypothetical protein
MRLRGVLLMALTALPACTGTPRAPSQQILDEQSGNTLLIVKQPLIFARERSDVAAHARDYATLVAVEVDASGTSHDYLLLYRWSTVDRRMAPPPAPDAAQLRILADGRVIDLTPLERVPVGTSRRRVMHVPVHGDVAVHAYAVEVSTLAFVAASRDVSVQLPQEPLPTPFKLWEDGREALAQFSSAAGSP